MESKNQMRALAALILVVVFGAYFFWKKAGLTPPAKTANTSTSATASATTSAASAATATTTKIGITGTGNFAIKNVEMTPKMPDYKGLLACSANVSADQCAVLRLAASTLSSRISVNTGDLKQWVNLGVIRKAAGDYEGARVVWEYVSAVSPSNPISFNNLGDLYANFLHNYPKAESNFLVAIKNKPNDTNPYISLFNIYSAIDKNKTSAEDILKKGIAANPKAVDMQVLLARYYKDNGRTAEAKAEYQSAMANAQAQGQTDLANQINEELAQM